MKTHNDSQSFLIETTGKEFMLAEPREIEEATEKEAREFFLRGKAFDFWSDPEEDGYTMEDGDEPDK